MDGTIEAVEAPAAAIGWANKGKLLFVGWPAVIVGKGNNPIVAPLLRSRAVVNTEDSSTPYMQLGGGVFELNLGVANEKHLDTSQVAEATELVARYHKEQGGSEDIGQLAEQVSVALGYSGVAPAPSILRTARGALDLGIAVVSGDERYAAGLINELKQLETRTDWGNTAARFLVFGGQPAQFPQSLSVAAPGKLSQSQENTVAAISTQDLSVVTGPPGTGKSQVVVTAVSNAILSGVTVMLTSTNNDAIKVAVERSREIDPLLLLRAGNRDHRQALPEFLSVALERDECTESERSIACSELARLAEKRSTYLAGIDQRSNLAKELGDLGERLLYEEHQLWPTGRPETVTPERVTAANHIWWNWGPFKKRHRRQVSTKFQTTPGQFDDLISWATCRAAVLQRTADLHALSAKLDPVAESLDALDEQRASLSIEAVRATAGNRAKTNEAKLTSLGDSREFQKSVTRALPAIKGWSSTTGALSGSFELNACLFDLAIVDEASQCKVADILPAAYRAQQIAVVGDPNQLSPIVKLDERLAKRFAEQTGLSHEDLKKQGRDYTTGSGYLAFEAAISPDRVHMLAEHYRCHPKIARWFNQAFYHNQLEIMTDSIETRLGEKDGLFWTDIPVDQDGRDGLDGVNMREATEAASLVIEAAQRGESVGVVCPFRPQAQLIDSLSEDLDSGSVLSGADFVSRTAHAFQGQERDTIIMSCVVTPASKPGTLKWIEDQRNLLNVAASRARRRLVVLGHPFLENNPSISTLSSLRKAAIEGLPGKEEEFLKHSWAERHLHFAMLSASLEPLLKVNIEGYELDFALKYPGFRLVDIEVDGSQHFDSNGRQRVSDVIRDGVLSHAGWAVKRVSFADCLNDPRSVVDDILTFLHLQALPDLPGK